MNRTGWWWNPAEPGSGLALEQQGEVLFLGRYTYTKDGDPVWTAAWARRTGKDTFAGEMRSYRNTPYPYPVVEDRFVLRFQDERLHLRYSRQAEPLVLERYPVAAPAPEPCPPPERPQLNAENVPVYRTQRRASHFIWVGRCNMILRNHEAVLEFILREAFHTLPRAHGADRRIVLGDFSAHRGCPGHPGRSHSDGRSLDIMYPTTYPAARAPHGNLTQRYGLWKDMGLTYVPLWKESGGRIIPDVDLFDAEAFYALILRLHKSFPHLRIRLHTHIRALIEDHIRKTSDAAEALRTWQSLAIPDDAYHHDEHCHVDLGEEVVDNLC